MKTPSRIKMAATVASVVRAATRPGAPSLQERVHAVPRLVRSTLHGAYAGTTLKRLGLVAGAVAYVASPIDLLPEAILPVVGAADDAVVISWAIKAFFEETDRFIAWEAGRGARVRPSTPPRERGGVLPLTARAAEAASGGTADTESDARAGRVDHVQLPQAARQAATDYVLESVRKRLER
ncbi:YkvA family protein [Terrabacter sp. BE26]|uniref:YkvA family protein n=1 Tax=Terrabacter sp. BE26 TaxID=2898152 RepID=UPI0035BE330D